MKLSKIIIVFFFFATMINAQLENPMILLRNLIGSWKIEGKWQNGDNFSQSITNEWGLGQKIIKTQTYGVINLKDGTRGLRNEGVRAYDPESKEIKFWEFDIFGGITKGKILTRDNISVFEYSYKTSNGKFELRDVWERISPDEYKYIVIQKKNDEWKTGMLSGSAKRK